MYSNEAKSHLSDDIASTCAERLRCPSAVRYIKLGRAGVWAAAGIVQGTIPFGFHQIAHDSCAEGDWETAKRQLRAAGRTRSGITQGIRELRDFYCSDDRCLWVTFADRHLYWAFAESDVVPMEESGGDEPSRFRRTIDGWHRVSLSGEPLSVRSLSSALTRVAGYRMTICTVEREDYLLRRIRGEEEPLQIEAREIQVSLEGIAGRLITQLDWRDFEIMVDLIFARGGWQRQSAIGDGEVDIDLMLNNPTTGESAWVQVKSRANQATVDDYLDRFRRDGSCDRFYFVCHSPMGALGLADEQRLHLWAGEELAQKAISAGLFEWLIERTR